MTCLEKKLCDIVRGCVTWKEDRLCLQGCKRFSGQQRSRKNLQIHSWARKIQELVLVHHSGQSKPKTSLPYLTRSIGPPSQNSRVLSQHAKNSSNGTNDSKLWCIIHCSPSAPPHPIDFMLSKGFLDHLDQVGQNLFFFIFLIPTLNQLFHNVKDNQKQFYHIWVYLE